MGALGASCFHTLSDENRRIDKEPWDLERVGLVCGKAEAFADWKKAILKLCKKTKACTFEEKRMLKKFIARMERSQVLP